MKKVKTLLSVLCGFTLILCISSTINVYQQRQMGKKIKSLELKVEEEFQKNKRQKNYTDLLIKALIQVESRGDAKVVNSKSGATGVLQLMPVYVKDVNRILGEKKYTLKDRLNHKKSLEMFYILQKHYSGIDLKEEGISDVDSVIEIIKRHNPKASDVYLNKVLAQMFLINNKK